MTVVYTPRESALNESHLILSIGKSILTKLNEFYDNCFAPEIVCPLYSVGLPMRDLRSE